MYSGFKADMALIMTTLSMLSYSEVERTENEFGMPRSTTKEKDRAEHKIAALKKHCLNLDIRFEELVAEDIAESLANMVNSDNVEH